MLNFAEQTGSGAVIVVWSFLPHTTTFSLSFAHASAQQNITEQKDQSNCNLQPQAAQQNDQEHKHQQKTKTKTPFTTNTILTQQAARDSRNCTYTYSNNPKHILDGHCCTHHK
jgi:hypothetical protein